MKTIAKLGVVSALSLAMYACGGDGNHSAQDAYNTTYPTVVAEINGTASSNVTADQLATIGVNNALVKYEAAYTAALKAATYANKANPTTAEIQAVIDSVNAAGGTRTVDIQFAAKAGTQVAACGTTLTNIGTKNSSGKIRDLRFYVSEVHLLAADGTEVPVTLDSNDWQSNGTVLVDMEDGTDICATGGTSETNFHVKGTAPIGTYTGAGFSVAVPEAVNHTEVSTAPKPLDIAATAWSWQSGRKFTKIEFNPSPDGTGVNRPATATTKASTSSTFNVHLGATGCSADATQASGYSCTNLNHMLVHSHAFNIDTQQMVLDIQKLFANNDVTTDLGSSMGCMSGKTDPECAGMFKTFGIDLETGVSTNDGHDQSVFRVEAK